MLQGPRLVVVVVADDVDVAVVGVWLVRGSRACQSVAQLDQRRLAVNPACCEGHVWESAAGNGMSTGRVQDLWSARALLKRVSERCSDRPARRCRQERKTACVQ